MMLLTKDEFEREYSEYATCPECVEAGDCPVCTQDAYTGYASDAEPRSACRYFIGLLDE
jgi:primosomal protein N'